MGSPAQALTFAKKHLEISQEVSQPRPALSPLDCLLPALSPPPPTPCVAYRHLGRVPLCALDFFLAVAFSHEGAPPARDFRAWRPLLSCSQMVGSGQRGPVLAP